MKRNLTLAFLAFVAWVPLLSASTKQSQSKEYQRGTIVSVEKHEVRSPQYAGGDNPSDAPLSSDYYAYDVSVRVSCGTYVGHYESPYDYLPAAFAPNKSVEVRIAKHDMYFEIPGESEMRMPISHRRTERGGPCGTSTASR